MYAHPLLGFNKQRDSAMKGKILFALAPVLFSTAVNAGIIEPNVIWDKKELKTCFFDDNSQLAHTILETKKNTKENFDFSPKKLRKSQKQAVYDVISKEFSASRTGIYFTGFQDCSKVRNPDVIVMRAASKIILLDTPSFRGRAVIGEAGVFQTYTEFNPKTGASEYVMDKDGTFHEGFFEKSGKTAFVALRTTNYGTIVHEFGHVAGLRHEHIREEAANDKNCGDFRVVWPTKEKLYDTAQMETNYDAKSIMNYCYLQSRSGRVFEENVGNILSAGDIQTLKAHY